LYKGEGKKRRKKEGEKRVRPDDEVLQFRTIGGFQHHKRKRKREKELRERGKKENRVASVLKISSFQP